MPRTRRLALVGTMAAAIAAGGGAAAAPASAAPHPTCPTGYHCVFLGPLGTTPRYAFFNSDGKFSDNYFPGGITVNNQVAAASNSSSGGYESHYYQSAGYTNGLVFCVNPGHATPSVLPGTKQNQASSLMLRPATSISCY